MSAEASPSPRPSLSLRSPSSSRTSLDVPPSNNSNVARPSNPRRNRAALRDYYGIKSSADDASSSDGTPQPNNQSLPTILGDLDRKGFDAAAYVKNLLEKESLDSVLKVEGALVSEIRGLDGERKALVYDNYAKLIAATDTIQKVLSHLTPCNEETVLIRRQMRTNMDPLTPATSTLAPAISHIAETAATLSKELAEHVPQSKDTTEVEREATEVQIVCWVLDAPRRFRQWVEEDRRTEAESEWTTIRELLEKWRGVDGATEVKKECEVALRSGSNRPTT